MFIGGIIALVLGGVLLYAGSRQKKIGSSMQQVKVIPIHDAAAGTQVEIEGTIECGMPLSTPYSRRECVAYQYTLEREERTQSSQGTPTSRWETVSRDNKSVSFIVRDSSGSLMVNPQGASLELQDLGEQLVRPSDMTDNPLFKTMLNVLTNSNTRVHEKALLVGSHAYVFGKAVAIAGGLAIEKDSNDLFISYKTEVQVERDKTRSAALYKIIGSIALLAGIALIIYSLISR